MIFKFSDNSTSFQSCSYNTKKQCPRYTDTISPSSTNTCSMWITYYEHKF
nr:MAG TPA: hypothetical protein [Caudoviricetes sp.]